MEVLQNTPNPKITLSALLLCSASLEASKLQAAAFVVESNETALTNVCMHTCMWTCIKRKKWFPRALSQSDTIKTNQSKMYSWDALIFCLISLHVRLVLPELTPLQCVTGRSPHWWAPKTPRWEQWRWVLLISGTATMKERGLCQGWRRRETQRNRTTQSIWVQVHHFQLPNALPPPTFTTMI